MIALRRIYIGGSVQNIKKIYRGLVVFDVDGVLFRKIFLIRVARTAGLRKYLRTLFLGWRYYTNGIDLPNLLDESLKLLKNFDSRTALRIARSIPRSQNITASLKILHEQGYFVSLMSSGIPNYVLEQLSREIGADHCAGLDVRIEGDRISIDTVTVRPKHEIVEGLLSRLGLTWDRVISVVDDPNNLTLMRKSRVGIGFNPSRIIRRHADVVVDGYDMLEVIPHIIPEHRLPPGISLKKQLLKRELYRKAIHFLGVPIPFLAYYNRNIVVALLTVVIVFYSLSELFRTFGFHFPFISYITKRSERITETRRIITGPLSLTIGILATLFFFPVSVYMPAILIVCIADSLSSLVGRAYGRVALPFFQRTIEGSLAFFLSSLGILVFFCPFPEALVTAALATVIELFIPNYLDNLLIPLGTAVFMHMVLPL
jgi:phytol kinase